MTRLIAALVALMALTGSLAAHEVRPAVADLTAQDGQVRIDLRFNAEAILAGVDLTGVLNTDDTDRSDAVDRLRRLEPWELEQELSSRMAPFLEPIRLRAGNTRLRLQPAGIQAGPLGNPELPRETQLTLVADMPRGSTSVDLFWPARYGTLILRQQGVDAPYTGYLSGQSSGPIEVAGGRQALWQALVTHITLGAGHVIPAGLDHALFALALALLSMRSGAVLTQGGALIGGHLAAPALVAAGMPLPGPALAEPLIAAGIALLALDNLVFARPHALRLALIVVLGVLHGMGLADTLTRLGMTAGQVLAAMGGFQLGLALGQLGVLAAALLLMRGAGQGDDMARPTQVLSGAGLLILGALAAFGPPQALPLSAAFAVLSALTLAAALAGNTPAAWRRWVARPGSGAIAALALWGAAQMTVS